MSPNRAENVVVAPRILSLPTYTAQHANQRQPTKKTDRQIGSRARSHDARGRSRPRLVRQHQTQGSLHSYPARRLNDAPKSRSARNSEMLAHMNLPHCFMTDGRIMMPRGHGRLDN